MFPPDGSFNLQHAEVLRSAALAASMSANQLSIRESAFGENIMHGDSKRTLANKRRAAKRRRDALMPPIQHSPDDYAYTISESGKEIYSCAHCTKTFGRIYNLRSHIKVCLNIC